MDLSGKTFDFVKKPLPPEILLGSQKAYFTEFSKHVTKEHLKSVCIDKLPLNLLKIPLIRQLYPKAKYILALRHPMDTILSCWMQNFKLNAAMSNMVDLDRIVDLYCVAMETFRVCGSDFELDVHTIRYEDLLDDLSGETSKLLSFFNLAWEAQMEDYRATALKRGRIHTPSYSQVVEPIYKDAQYRWLKYEKYLDKYLNQLDPWIKEFGYAEI